MKRYWSDVIGILVAENTVEEVQQRIGAHQSSAVKRAKLILPIATDEIELTYREAETLYFIASRHTVPETAILMGLSTRTVEFYVVNLRAKFRCRSKLELIQLIFEEGCLAKIRDYL